MVLCAGPVHAHKVYVFAWVENGRVYTESSFGDKRVVGGAITVTDDGGRQLLTATTNDNGECSFPVPDAGDSGITISLEAGMGHKASWRLEASELRQADPEPALEKAMAQKKELEDGPGYKDILSGLMVIFGIAFAASVIHKARKRKGRHG